MWPTSERFTEVLGSDSRRWATRLEVFFEGEKITTLSVVLDGSVSLDSVAVRRAVNLTIVDPLGDLTPATAKDLLAPKGTELRLWRGLFVDTDYEWVPLGVFGIVSMAVSAHGSSGTTIALKAFDRADAVRSRRFTAPYPVTGGTPTHEVIAGIVESRIPGVIMRITASGHTTPERVFDRLSDPWEKVTDVAEADALAAYFDPLGSLIVTPELTQETGIVYTPGPGSLLIESEREIDVDTTYSGVQVSGEHPDQDPIFAELWDTNPNSPTYADGPFGRRPYGFASPIITTLSQAQLAAATLLPRVSRMRQRATLITIGHPGHEIGDIVEVVDPETRTTGRWVIAGGSIPVRRGATRLNLVEVPAFTGVSDSGVVEPVAGRVLLDEDSFNKPDSTTSLGTTREGRAWRNESSVDPYGIIDGRAYLVKPNINETATVDMGRTQLLCEMRCTLATGCEWSMVINWTSFSSYAYTEVYSDGSAYLRTNSAGTVTEYVALPAGTFVSGDVVGLERAASDELVLYRNGVEVTRQTALVLPGTRVGMRYGNNTAGPQRWDDFAVRSVL